MEANHEIQKESCILSENKCILYLILFIEKKNYLIVLKIRGIVLKKEGILSLGQEILFKKRGEFIGV